MEEIDVKQLMKERLPPYAVNCLLATGYDSADVIYSMNTSEEPDNSFVVIEKFIDQYFRGSEEYYSNSILCQHQFVFPPGHKVRIANFVSEVRSICRPTLLSKERKRKQQASSHLLIAKSQRIDDKLEPKISISSVMTQIRGSICRWVKAQSPNLRNLKEKQHFVINVTENTQTGCLSVSLRCNACQTGINLHQKCSSTSCYQISNWTRHVKSCKKLSDKQGGHQQTLGIFLTNAGTPSCSPSTNSNKCVEYSDSFSEDTSQHFEEAPPNMPIVHASMEGWAQHSIVDWSRSARNQRMLLKAAEHVDQTRIMDYYTLIDDIQRLMPKHDVLSTLKVQEQDAMPFSVVLKTIIANAERNANVLPYRKRHPDILKKFATALFIYAGPLAYDFLQQNLHQALPSLRTIQRVVHAHYKTINEGEFDYDGLVCHIAQYKTTKMVTIGEDATRVISRVEYDSKTNRCVGFVLPLNKNGLPEIDSFLALSFEGIENMFTNHTKAKYAYVYMAQPLDKNVPAFWLACFGTDNKFTAEHIVLRWQTIVKECKKREITVISFGGDGDSRLMKAMSVSLFSESQLRINTTIIPSAWNEWFWIKKPSGVAYVQDVVHIAVKLKSRLIKPSIVLPMGMYLAGGHHLHLLHTTLGKDIHGLREKA